MIRLTILQATKRLAAVIENALRRSLAGRKATTERRKVTFTTSGAEGLCPGVDLDDSAGLLDLMENPQDR